jgi:hypothetical protein
MITAAACRLGFPDMGLWNRKTKHNERKAINLKLLSKTISTAAIVALLATGTPTAGVHAQAAPAPTTRMVADKQPTANGWDGIKNIRRPKLSTTKPKRGQKVKLTYIDKKTKPQYKTWVIAWAVTNQDPENPKTYIITTTKDANKAVKIPRYVGKGEDRKSTKGMYLFVYVEYFAKTGPKAMAGKKGATETNRTYLIR